MNKSDRRIAIATKQIQQAADNIVRVETDPNYNAQLLAHMRCELEAIVYRLRSVKQ